MDSLWIFLARIRALLMRNQLDRDLDDEIEAHLELLTMEYRQSGMNPEEAARAARLRLGGIEQTKEEVRDAHRIPWVANFLRDAAEGMRKWRRQPGIVIVTVVTLAIGVGANMAMYDLVNALMFQPPDGVTAPERLVSLREVNDYVRYSDIRDQSKLLDVAAYDRMSLSFGNGADAALLCVECVTPSFFPILGARPAIGRIFMTDENAERRQPGVMLSYALWQRDYGGDPHVLGKSISISGRGFSIIGVAPKGFRGVEPEAVDAWVLLPAAPDICSFTGRSLLGDSAARWLQTIGRLRDGVTLPQAAAEIESLAVPEAQVERAMLRGKSQLEPLQDFRRDPDAERLALWLAGGALVVLVIACANVAGLSSIRALDRRREIAIRLQLGADRSRILAQHAAEHLVLALISGAAAALTAGWLASALQAFFSFTTGISLFDWRLFATACALTMLAGTMSGMIAALQVSRVDAAGLACSSISASDRNGFSKALLMLQVALALILVVCAGLFVRSVQNTRRGLGVDLDHVVIATGNLKKAGFQSAGEIRPVFDLMVDRIRRLPGIESISLSDGSLFGAGTSSISVSFMKGVNGKDGGAHAKTAITPEYFFTLGTPMISGRAFTDADNEASERVMIIDQAMAETMWPGEPSVGKYVSAGYTYRVIGVCQSRRASAGYKRSGGETFVPLAQAARSIPQSILIRTRGPAAGAVKSIAAVVRGEVPNLPFIDVQPVEGLVDDQTRSWRVGRSMFSAFSVVTVLLAALGLYAVLAFSVRRRVSEIGVRMAIGATTTDIVRLVFRQGLWIAAAGWVLGVGAALWLTKYVEKLLFQVEPLDPLTFTIASLIILTAAVAGCLLPSIRAARVDPVVALRHE